MRATVVDIFCGIGGLSYGFKAEGFDVAAGIDIDSTCRFAYETNLNAEFISDDIKKITGPKINRLFGAKDRPRVLIGCAPCAPFSIYVGRYKKANRRNRQWSLLDEFLRIIKTATPDVVSMENVPRLARHKIFFRFVRTLEKKGYNVAYAKLRADHYGVPQRRTRLVLIASRLGEVSLPRPTHLNRPVTVRNAIGKLPVIRAGKPSKRDRLHVTRNLTPRNLKRLRSTREGGSWRDWADDLQLDCHKKKKGRSFRSVYGRMVWDAPSPVITTQCLGIGNGRFGHPDQDRAISIREASLLQSFPRTFRFLPTGESVNGVMLARQIGNAVPVRLSQAIARAIKQHLREFWTSNGASRGHDMKPN